MSFVVAALYHFFDFPHFERMRAPLLEELTARSICGSLLITPEGINGTIAGSRQAMHEFLAYLKNDVIKSDFDYKESFCETKPFKRTKVRLKKETISIGEKVSLKKVGTYVSAHEWNALIDDPETIIIDARNRYEVHLGTFERAHNPDIRTFKKLPAYVRNTLDPAKHKKIATFCTGGIRCEKFSAWMLDQGFEEVYHLKGGILKYLEEIPESESRWQGECYVFDERIAVGHGLAASQTATLCAAREHTLTQSDQAQPHYVQDEHCPYCYPQKNAATAANLLLPA